MRFVQSEKAKQAIADYMLKMEEIKQRRVGLEKRLNKLAEPLYAEDAPQEAAAAVYELVNLKRNALVFSFIKPEEMPELFEVTKGLIAEAGKICERWGGYHASGDRTGEEDRAWRDLQVRLSNYKTPESEISPGDLLSAIESLSRRDPLDRDSAEFNLEIAVKAVEYDVKVETLLPGVIILEDSADRVDWSSFLRDGNTEFSKKTDASLFRAKGMADKAGQKELADSLEEALSLVEQKEKMDRVTEREMSGVRAILEPAHAEVVNFYMSKLESLPLRSLEGNGQTYEIPSTFGVELELFFPEAMSLKHRTDIAKRLFDKLGIETTSTGGEYKKWQITTDSSIDMELEGSTGPGLEVVSPVLTGERGQKELRRVMRAFRMLGASVNWSCGTHVHLGAADLVGPANHHRQKALLRNYALNENYMEKTFVSQERTGSAYGRGFLEAEKLRKEPVEKRPIDFEMELQGPEPDPSAPISAAAERVGALSKSTPVKLTGLAGPTGTVEFRQLQGTLEPDEVLAWTEAASYLVRQAIESPGRVPNMEVEFTLDTKIQSTGRQFSRAPKKQARARALPPRLESALAVADEPRENSRVF